MSRLIRRSRAHPAIAAPHTILSVSSGDDVSGKNEAKKPAWGDKCAKVRVILILAAASIGLCIALQYCWPQHYQQNQRHLPVYLHSIDNMHAFPLSLSDDPPRFVRDRRNHYWIDHGVERHDRVKTEPENCTVLNSNHDDNYPSCNDFHQIDLTDFWLFEDRHTISLEGVRRQSKLRHVGEGGFRNAFYISEYNGTRRVLKTLVWRDDRPFDPKNVDRNRKDAVIASLLTSSPVVANIYGYCAQSALVDYSDDWDLYNIFDGDDKDFPTKDYLFDLAVDIAQSIADAHLYNSEGQATVVHMDLKPDQWIKLNGKYVLNDFNLAKFISFNKDTNEYCNLASGYSDGRWQAPEQFNYNYPRTEKADIFALGYILNFLLTRDKPFPEQNGTQVMKFVMNGGIWSVPKHYILSKHPFDSTLQYAVKWCLKFEPSERPSAQQVADYLSKARDQYKVQNHTV